MHRGHHDECADKKKPAGGGLFQDARSNQVFVRNCLLMPSESASAIIIA